MYACSTEGTGVNKRLRKKLHKGEFKELGVQLNLTLHAHLTESDLDKWWDEFIPEVERIGLSVGGGGHYEHEYGVCSASKRGSVTLAQQGGLRQWLAECSMVERFEISESFDHYCPDV